MVRIEGVDRPKSFELMVLTVLNPGEAFKIIDEHEEVGEMVYFRHLKRAAVVWRNGAIEWVDAASPMEAVEKTV